MLSSTTASGLSSVQGEALPPAAKLLLVLRVLCLVFVSVWFGLVWFLILSLIHPGLASNYVAEIVLDPSISLPPLRKCRDHSVHHSTWPAKSL